MNRLITIYWRDIPSHVLGRRGRKTVFKQALDSRFEQAIERAARRAGSGSSKQYFEDWRRESQSCEGDLEEAAAVELARLDAMFPPEQLERVVRASGVLPPEDR
ncbi:MAG: virulence factor [Myxococcota bacterium]|nr:virulence factor [Myxococcota bacterium]